MSPIADLLANYRSAIEAGHITEEYANRGMYQALAPVIANYAGHARADDTRTTAQLQDRHEYVCGILLGDRQMCDIYATRMAVLGFKIITDGINIL